MPYKSLAMGLVLLILLSAAHAATPSIWKAAADGNLEALDAAIAASADVNAPDDIRGWTPLARAALAGHAKVVQRLLDAGAEPEKPTRDHLLPLMMAAASGNEASIQALLDAGANVNRANRPKSLPLAFAATKGHLPAIRLLIKAGADVTLKDHEGETAVHAAAREGHLEVVKLLAEHGAWVLDRNRYGVTPIMQAAGSGNLDLVKYLVDHGARADDLTEYHSAVGLATEHNHREIVIYLLDHGAPLEPGLNYEASLLELASANGNVELARELLRRGAPFDPYDCGLNEAAIAGHEACVALLLEKGAICRIADQQELIDKVVAAGHFKVALPLVQARRRWNEVPPSPRHVQEDELLAAAFAGDGKKVQALLAASETWDPAILQAAFAFAEQQGQVEARRALRQPLSVAVERDRKQQELSKKLIEASDKGDLTQVRALLASGADGDAHDPKSGFGAIHEAASKGHIEIVKLLIDHGAKINALRGYGSQTPLRAAASAGKADVVKLLLERGADPHHVDDMFTAMDLAASHGHVEVMKLLHAAKVDVNQPSFEKRTALIGAAEGGHLDAVTLLVEWGADVNRADRRGVTAIAAAESKFHGEVAAFLKSQGGKAGVARPTNPLFDALHDPQRFKTLLDKGADPRAVGGVYHTTILGNLAYLGTPQQNVVEIIKLLVDRKVDLSQPPDAICHFAFGPGEPSTEVVKLLLDQGVDPNVRMRHGNSSALMRAAENGQIATVKVLLDAGADPTLVNDAGKTAADLARGRGHDDVVQFLMQPRSAATTRPRARAERGEK